MLEDGRIARRTAALPGGGEGAVRVLPAASRLSLRLKGVAVPPRDPRHDRRGGEASADVLGLSLALPVTRCAASGDRIVARLGPDEWLVLGPEADTDAMSAEIAAALAGRFHALVDVSHRSVALAVEGPGAADILNAGCPLDLHDTAFPPGSATRTLLGKAEIVLLRPTDAPAFRVETWRSFAPYVHGFLREAARD